MVVPGPKTAYTGKSYAQFLIDLIEGVGASTDLLDGGAGMHAIDFPPHSGFHVKVKTDESLATTRGSMWKDDNKRVRNRDGFGKQKSQATSMIYKWQAVLLCPKLELAKCNDEQLASKSVITCNPPPIEPRP